MAEVSPANINETSNSNTDESKLANDNADSNQLTNEIAVNNDDNSQDGDSEWKIMTAEEEERERSLDEEVEIKKQLIEKVLEEHETWRVEYHKKKERVTSRWKALQEKREHRKFIEEMMSS